MTLEVMSDESDINESVGVKCRCPCYRKEQTIQVKLQDMLDWKHGKHVQDAFSYPTPDEREALVSGICSKCWSEMFNLKAPELASG